MQHPVINLLTSDPKDLQFAKNCDIILYKTENGLYDLVIENQNTRSTRNGVWLLSCPSEELRNKSERDTFLKRCLTAIRLDSGEVKRVA